MMKIDEINHDDHKHLKYYIDYDYQILDIISKKKIVMSTYLVSEDIVCISSHILPALSNKISVISGNDVIRKNKQTNDNV